MKRIYFETHSRGGQETGIPPVSRGHNRSQTSGLYSVFKVKNSRGFT